MACGKRFETKPGFAKQALRDIRNSTRPRATQALLRALLYRLQRDRKQELTINDAIDMFHCVVPAAYCDFVLLDRKWSAQLNDARTFLRRSGLQTRVAQQFTLRDDGVIKFLDTLEAWPKHAAAFLRGLELSGARPKELAEAVASDFDGKRLKLSHRKGRPPRLRSRYVVLDADADGVVFFKSQAEGKTANDYLLSAAAGKGWRLAMWAAELRIAISKHNRTVQGRRASPRAPRRMASGGGVLKESERCAKVM
jgi:integrase